MAIYLSAALHTPAQARPWLPYCAYLMHVTLVTFRSQMGVGVSWQVGRDQICPRSTASEEPPPSTLMA